MPNTCERFDDQITWCMAVARNRMRNWVRDELRTYKRGSLNSEPVSNELMLELTDALAEVHQAEHVQNAYHEGRIAEALAALPGDSYRKYVKERFWYGIPTTELHKRMSPSYWTRTKKRLAVELKDLVTK